MSATFNHDDPTTWTLDQLCEGDEEDKELYERRANEWRRRLAERAEVDRKCEVEVARRKAEMRREERKERRIVAARRRAEGKRIESEKALQIGRAHV